MPGAVGRIILLIPIVSAITDRVGFNKGSNGRTGVMLAAIFSTVMPAFAILPANVPNMIFAGMAETHFQITMYYGHYFWLHFPVLGFLKMLIMILLILWLFPDRPQKIGQTTVLNSDTISKNEKLLFGSLIILMLLWITDFTHHISPAWVTLAGAVFLMFPGINIVDPKRFSSNINFSILFFVAGLLGLGGMVFHTGLGDKLANHLIELLPLDQNRPFANYILLGLVSTLTGIAVTVAGIPAVITPLCVKLSAVSGFALETVLMTQVLGFSSIILPYQLAPLVVGMEMSGEKLVNGIKLCLLLLLVTFLVLLPANYLWWQATGWI
jgi:hypothetical protein